MTEAMGLLVELEYDLGATSTPVEVLISCMLSTRFINLFYIIYLSRIACQCVEFTDL